MDSVGVFLWANRAQYAEVSFQTVSDSDIGEIGLPTMQEDTDEDGPLIPLLISFVPNGPLRDLFLRFDIGAYEFSGLSTSCLIGPQSLDSSHWAEDVFSSPDQLAEELATLTLLPRSRWQTLLKLEVIQVSHGIDFLWQN